MTRSRSSTACSSASVLLATALAAAAALFAPPPAAAGARPHARLFLAHPYPIEAYPSFPAGLFHWVDSLAGTSVGKTVPAHRSEYVRLFGRPDASDVSHLEAFVAAREAHGRREAEIAARDGVSPRASAMLGVFCASATLGDALAALKPELPESTWKRLAEALEHFRPKYEVVWRGGAVPRAFLDAARRDPGLPVLEALLARIVKFYAVDPLASAPPRIALVPVPRGWGTHAEAIGNILLLEIRDTDTLADEASVLVHENAHFLWTLVPPERRLRFAAAASERGDETLRTYRLFHEAIPTALGQGVTDRAFRPAEWSVEDSWYHTDDVDRCAKRIFPIVAGALDSGGTLDERWVLSALRAASDPP